MKNHFMKTAAARIITDEAGGLVKAPLDALRENVLEFPGEVSTTGEDLEERLFTLRAEKHGILKELINIEEQSGACVRVDSILMMLESDENTEHVTLARGLLKEIQRLVESTALEKYRQLVDTWSCLEEAERDGFGE